MLALARLDEFDGGAEAVLYVFHAGARAEEGADGHHGRREALTLRYECEPRSEAARGCELGIGGVQSSLGDMKSRDKAKRSGSL